MHFGSKIRLSGYTAHRFSVCYPIAQKYELVARRKTDRVHLLSAIVKCPVCGAGMYGNKSIKKRPDGTKYKDFFYYGCKHRGMQRGYKCTYSRQIQEEVLDGAVAEVISKLVSNPKFAAMMQEKINRKVDTTAIEQEIAAYEKQLRQYYSTKSRLMEEIDNLDPDDRHFISRKSDLDDRLYKTYDKIEDAENGLMDARAKKQAIEADKITGDNIYKILICFDKLYATMNEAERRKLVEILIDEVQIYPERQANGQWLKSIRFKLPIIDHDLDLSLDNQNRVETVCSLIRAPAQIRCDSGIVAGREEGKWLHDRSILQGGQVRAFAQNGRLLVMQSHKKCSRGWMLR